MAEPRITRYRHLNDPCVSLLPEEQLVKQLEEQHFKVANRLAEIANLEARKFAAANRADLLREDLKRMGEEPCA